MPDSCTTLVTPEQLERDLAAFRDQVKSSLVGANYLERRTAAQARFAGIDVVSATSDVVADADNENDRVAPPTMQERSCGSFLG